MEKSSAEKSPGLSSCQEKALKQLDSDQNIFLTGVAGSGKSFLLRHYLARKGSKEYPVLASTGAAAILIGGRTFHSFFGLGIMDGGAARAVAVALNNSRVRSRVRKAIAVVIDELSMLSGEALAAAEEIARSARRSDEPWGGLRVIGVGDFAQLPPVTRGGEQRKWAFQNPVWKWTNFQPAILSTIMRQEDDGFLSILNKVRRGKWSEDVQEFFQGRAMQDDGTMPGTRLFPRKDATQKFNDDRLAELPGAVEEYPTEYTGSAKGIQALKTQAPIDEVLRVKGGALVMLRQNDPIGRWVNGSLGKFIALNQEGQMEIRLLKGTKIKIDKSVFTLSDAEGNPVATAINFPINLAWASTIHKAQGSTFDRLIVDLRRLWEPGHAYVALSRVRTAEGLYVTGWSPSSVRVSPEVVEFHQSIGMH